MRLSARREDVVDRLLRRSSIAAFPAAAHAGIIHDHRCAMFGAKKRDFPPDAAPGTCHGDNLTFQHAHASLSFVTIFGRCHANGKRAHSS
jgi:hypothetical protein